MVSQEILVSLCDFRRRQRGRGAPIHLPLPIGGPKGCHLAELEARSPLMLPLPTMPVLLSSDPTVTVKVSKKDRKKEVKALDHSGRRETFQGDNSCGN